MDERERELRERERGLTKGELARRTGRSDVVIRQVRNDHDSPLTQDTASGIERAWRWATGSVQRILDGLDPVEVEPGTVNIPHADDTGVPMEDLAWLTEAFSHDRPMYWRIVGAWSRAYEQGLADGYARAVSESAGQAS